MKKRILLATFGSLGDLHPYVALALGLQARGHDVVIGTSPFYQAKIEALGIGFRGIRPDRPPGEFDPEFIRRVMDLRLGTRFVVRDLMMPVIRESYDDTLAAAAGADLLVSHPLTFTVRLVAEKKGIPWASTMLQPFGFVSIHDPPVVPGHSYLAALRFLGPAFQRILFGAGERIARRWCGPWYQLRADLGLPPTRLHPLFDGQHAPALVLALFSRFLAEKQPDWPRQTVVTGFPFYDQDGDPDLSAELVRFLDDGPAPLVFTLGSSAVLDAGGFYEVSAAVARRLGRRAVLVVGKETNNRPSSLPPGVMAVDYAPFSRLFPRAAVIVHQGGVGTTGQALHAGRPMLVMPYAHDQPDNAARITRLGVGRTIPRKRYTVDRAVANLQRLLESPAYAARAAEVGAEVRQEDGIRSACEALELLFARSQEPSNV